MVKKSAFTLFELVVVIAVIGILSAVAYPRIKRDNLTNALDQLVAHLRYTQHLAMVNDVFNPRQQNWFRARWQMSFFRCNATDEDWAYTVSSNTNLTNGVVVGRSETARDPLTQERLYISNTNCLQNSGDYPKLNLMATYNVASLTFSGCNQQIAFDTLGRPYESVNNANSHTENYLTTDCTITITMDDGDTASIVIHKETGYIEKL